MLKKNKVKWFLLTGKTGMFYKALAEETSQ